MSDDGSVVEVLVPCVDVTDGRAVDPVRFSGIRDPHDPAEIARWYAAHGVSRIFFDVLDDWDGIHTVSPLVSSLRGSGVSVLMSVGNGRLRSVSAAERLLDEGVSALSVSTDAVENPSVVERLARTVEEGRIMGAVNAGEGPLGPWSAYVHGGRTAAGEEAPAFARRLAELGARLILANSADREGTGLGYDHALTRAVAGASGVPVIASGGCGRVDHLVEALESGTADYVLANKALHRGDLPLHELLGRSAERENPSR
ncbi:cyclase [Actinopolyspora biskrensis]|uniref:Cyclase n=1 Tax=Actinopolyspora biskrensis TaxID=1470178 RepID=A0A852YR39_9ACTN|nr:HisA/HisF-related TIM barrel protein [Actinopolyspora biskrensis]NYH77704.1 cyclase [Actinopolyspora biskrensis]